MAWGKSEERKRADAEARAARAQAQAEEAYWTSPVGQADEALQNGARLFQIVLPVSSVDGYSNYAWGSGDVSSTMEHEGVGDVLGEIEELGWRLEHAGWVFVETGTSSRDKMLASGQRASTSGRVDGIYLFRRARLADED